MFPDVFFIAIAIIAVVILSSMVVFGLRGRPIKIPQTIGEKGFYVTLMGADFGGAFGRDYAISCFLQLYEDRIWCKGKPNYLGSKSLKEFFKLSWEKEAKYNEIEDIGIGMPYPFQGKPLVIVFKDQSPSFNAYMSEANMVQTLKFFQEKKVKLTERAQKFLNETK